MSHSAEEGGLLFESWSQEQNCRSEHFLRRRWAVLRRSRKSSSNDLCSKPFFVLIFFSMYILGSCFHVFFMFSLRMYIRRTENVVAKSVMTNPIRTNTSVPYKNLTCGNGYRGSGRDRMLQFYNFDRFVNIQSCKEAFVGMSTGPDFMILKIFLPKKTAKKMAFICSNCC
jgi:hypothetical protein